MIAGSLSPSLGSLAVLQSLSRCMLPKAYVIALCGSCRCNLEFITNKSQEGSQFCRGFGGIGGILRYSVEMADFEEPGDFEDGDEKAPKDADEWGQ